LSDAKKRLAYPAALPSHDISHGALRASYVSLRPRWLQRKRSIRGRHNCCS